MFNFKKQQQMRSIVKTPFNHFMKLSYRCSSISEIPQLQQANNLLSKNKLLPALEYYEKALTYLPLYIPGQQKYNNQLNQIIQKIVWINTWKGQLTKIKDLMSKVSTKWREDILINRSSGLVEAIQYLEVVDENVGKIDDENLKIVRERLAQIKKQQCKQQSKLIKLLTTNHKENGGSSSPQQSKLIQGMSIGLSFNLLLTQSLSSPLSASSAAFNDLTSSLLKQCESSSPQNLPKPLLLIITTLIKKQHYLQSQGMLNHCLDSKINNIQKSLLEFNQEYVLLKLLLGEVFTILKRQGQAETIFHEFGGKFDLRKLIFQGLVIPSINLDKSQ